jgi:hypothetical protein
MSTEALPFVQVSITQLKRIIARLAKAAYGYSFPHIHNKVVCIHILGSRSSSETEEKKIVRLSFHNSLTGVFAA